MWTRSITPGFADTDALGHINHTMMPVYFERGRDPVFQLFNPTMSVSGWNLILARIELDYRRETFYGQAIEIRTWVERVGQCSFTLYEEAWQNGACCVAGRCVMVHRDMQQGTSQRIPVPLRDALAQHLRDEGERS
jgi:acyl-CoA thioester hydrolase